MDKSTKKASAEENPAEKESSPVGCSLTSTSTIALSGELPCLSVISTSSKNLSARTLLRDLSSNILLKASPSTNSSSRRMT